MRGAGTENGAQFRLDKRVPLPPSPSPRPGQVRGEAMAKAGG